MAMGLILFHIHLNITVYCRANDLRPVTVVANIPSHRRFCLILGFYLHDMQNDIVYVWCNRFVFLFSYIWIHSNTCGEKCRLTITYQLYCCIQIMMPTRRVKSSVLSLSRRNLSLSVFKIDIGASFGYILLLYTDITGKGFRPFRYVIAC